MTTTKGATHGHDRPAQGVQKAFGDVVIIPALDLDIDDGEFVVFVGPSGCGKSTLLRLIAGLEDVTAGEIMIDGVDVANAAAGQARPVDGVPVLCALSAHERAQQHRASASRWPGMPKDEIDTQGREGGARRST